MFGIVFQLVQMLNIYVICVRFELVKSPEVTLCGYRGYNSISLQ